MARNGRYITFQVSGERVTGVLGSNAQAFVRDLSTGLTTLVSADATGQPCFRGAFAAGCSSNGRYVLFLSEDANIIVPDINQAMDAFVRDATTNATERVSENSFGIQAGGVQDARISGDGRWVALTSHDAYLVSGDTNGQEDVFLKDRATGGMTRVSLGVAGNELGYSNFPPQYGGAIGMIDINDDGRFVVFETWAINASPLDANSWRDVYLHDVASGTSEYISVDAAGQGSQLGGESPALSGDGRFVAFASRSPNIVAGIAPSVPQVYVRDRATGVAELISVDANGQPGNGLTLPPFAVSTDGRFVAFASYATNFASGDTNAVPDVFLRDRLLGSTRCVSVTSNGSLYFSSQGSRVAGLSDDGTKVMFDTAAGVLVPGDSNASWDAFVRDLSWPAPPISAYCIGKSSSNGCIPTIATAGAPDTAGSSAFFVTSTRAPNHRVGALVWSLAPAAPPYFAGSLCVAAPAHMLVRQDSNGHAGAGTDCSGWYSYAMTPALMSANAWTPGTTVYAQFFVRNPGTSNLALSQGLSFTVW
jgi:Tol biopolymer transport system component